MVVGRFAGFVDEMVVRISCALPHTRKDGMDTGDTMGADLGCPLLSCLDTHEQKVFSYLHDCYGRALEERQNQVR